jgi:phenylalanyl-tRNA synthetase beta chain
MKLTLDWLDFVDLPTTDPAEIAAAFEGLGFEIDEMRPLEPAFSGVVIGRVREVAAHPNADKVRVCQVDIGTEVSEIVCGAWNFEAGAIVPVALPGAMLGDFEIGRRAIRGVTSHGMICSEQELDVGEDASGIMVLNADYPDAADRIGEDFVSILPLPDTLFDVAVNPNRPDCMSVVGLARELAARYEIPLREPAPRLVVDDPGVAVTVRIEDEEACARFVGRQVRNITVGRSPHWMRLRLQAAGVRPISNVVDASNYAMIEIGHPSHAFDLDRLGDTVVVRRAGEDGSLVTLDDIERTLEPEDVVVCDATRPVALAGVMGGADTEVHDGTTAVLVEAAYWNPPQVLLTSKRLDLRSEASARFERGLDPNYCDVAADRVAELLVDIAGGEVAAQVDAYPRRIDPATIDLPLGEIPRVLGIDVSGDAAGGILGRLGFGVVGDDPLRVTVPTRRPDVTRPVDLVEEIARLHGFDNIPDRVATGSGGGLPVEEAMRRRVREVLVGAGYHEALTFSFLAPELLDALGLPDDDPRRATISVLNPLSEDEGVLRTALLPGLLRAAALNVDRHLPDVALFETGKVFFPGDDAIPDQPDRLAFVTVGRRGGDWEDPGRPVDLRDATGLWELIAHEMRLPEPALVATSAMPFHPGRAAEVSTAGEAVGVVGELHPRVVEAVGLRGRVVAGEIDIAPLLVERDLWQFTRPSSFPPAVFDLAFEVDAALPAASLLAAVDEAGGGLIERRSVFDVFSGGPIPEGRKSLAVRLVLRDPDRTLSDDDVAPIRRRIVAAVQERTGGELRGEA